MFGGSLNLTALLLAVFAFLADRFYSLKEGVQYISKPYKYLAMGTVVVICISSTTAILSFMYLNHISYPCDVQVLLSLFTIVIILIPILAITIAAIYLRG